VPEWGRQHRARQNKVSEGPATSDTAIPASAIKNGNLVFTTNPATLTAAPTVSGATAGCPNPNWTGVNPVLTLTSITLDIFQPVSTQIFHCTASNPNGLTSPVTLCLLGAASSRGEEPQAEGHVTVPPLARARLTADLFGSCVAIILIRSVLRSRCPPGYMAADLAECCSSMRTSKQR